MLRLICSGSQGEGLQSRIAVLDIGDPIYDFGIATGHAVPPGRPCEVKDFEGQKRPVSLVHIAENYQMGESTDWAVIRFDKISTDLLVRYKLKPLEDLGALEHTRFSFATARGLSENAQKCRLSILDFENGPNRVTHDCRAVPGQSGSPITYLSNGEHTLVGLHIGHLWMVKSPETGRPDRKGYINLLDVETIQDIQSVIAIHRS